MPSTRTRPVSWVGTGTLDQTALPDSVREVIGGRVARLGADAERVLAAAAVIGRDFDLDVLERATRVHVDSLLDILESAATSSLVQEVDAAPGRYNFCHALVQRTIYEDLGSTRRARTHEHVALALEDFCGDHPGTRVGELAHHWINATPPANIPQGHLLLTPGGRRRPAARWPRTTRSVTTPLPSNCASRPARPDPVLLLDLAIGLGTSQRQTGDPSFRITLLDAARRAARIGDVDRLVAACLANDRGFYSAVGATDREKVETLEMALELLPADHPDRALVLATLCSELAHGSPLDRRRALAEEAIAIAEATGDDAVMVRVLNHLHVPLQVPSMLEVTQARAAEGLVRAERIGDPVLLFWAAQWRSEAAARTGDLDEMDRCIAIHGAMAAAAEPAGLRLGTPVQCAPSGHRSPGTRIWPSSTPPRRSRSAPTAGQPDAAVIFGAQFNIVSGQRGTQSELIPLIEKMASETPDIPRMFFMSLLAKAHVEGDRVDRAAELLEEFAAAGFQLPLDQMWLTGMVDFAEAAIECRDAAACRCPVRAARALGGPAARHRGFGPRPGQPLPRGPGHGHRSSSTGRTPTSTQAAAISQRMGAKFFAARTDLLWGKMLAERRAPGDSAKARTLLTKAQAIAAANGYGNVERRAAEALQRLD